MKNTSSLLVEISVGELLDKITILELKIKHITDSSRLHNVKADLGQLKRIFKQDVHVTDQVL